MAKPAGDSARKTALRLLASLRDGQSLSDSAISLKNLPPAEQARATRLAAEVLRHYDQADMVISQYINRKPAPAIADILRLATVEMLELGAAAHGVVDTAVNTARAQGQRGQAAAGMVNAVLRKIARHEGWLDMAPQRMPVWLRRKAIQAWGKPAVQAIEAAHQAGAPLDLTLKPDAVGVPQGIQLPTGSLRISGSVQVSALPGFAEGDWWVQDAAAALPVRLLDPQAGERIADICAAPGGKTLQLASSGAIVTAVDISEARMGRVAENLKRCHLSAELVTADALDWTPDVPLDAILLDAPCSATGTIRRHPDLPFLRDGSGISDLADLQSRLLDHALSLLRPGGRLVYSVCSLLQEEGESQIANTLSRHPNVSAEPLPLPGTDPAWATPEGGLRLRPDYWSEIGGMDGFYMARLKLQTH